MNANLPSSPTPLPRQARSHPPLIQHAVETWKLAHRLVLDLYQVSARLPQDERDGLTKTIRQSAVRVASHIVAGHAKEEPAAFGERVTEATAALEETKYTLLVARDLGYLNEQTYDGLITDAELFDY